VPSDYVPAIPLDLACDHELVRLTEGAAQTFGEPEVTREEIHVAPLHHFPNPVICFGPYRVFHFSAASDSYLALGPYAPQVWQ